MQQNLSVFGKTYRNLTTVSFSMAAVHLQSLYKIFHLKLIAVDHLLPLLTISLDMLISRFLRVFCCLSLLYLKKRSNCFLTSTISRHWAQQDGISSCFSFGVQYCHLLISFSSFQFAHWLVKILLLADGVAVLLVPS